MPELLADGGRRQVRAFPPPGDVIEAREHENGRQRDPSVERGRFYEIPQTASEKNGGICNKPLVHTNKAAQHDTQERDDSLSIVVPRRP